MELDGARRVLENPTTKLQKSTFEATLTMKILFHGFKTYSKRTFVRVSETLYIFFLEK